MRRRHLLATAAGALSLAAGCRSDPESSPDTTTPSGTTEPTETTVTATTSTETTTIAEPRMRELPTTPPDGTIDCDASPYPIRAGIAGPYPERAGGFELTASTNAVAIGDRITFTLTNVGDDTRVIGEKYKYNILRRGTDEWEPVFYTPEQAVYTDLGIRVRPGGGFRWPFVVDQDGLERKNGEANMPYHVCSPLEPGEYRFAFFGLGDDAVATEFSVQEH